MAKNKKAGNGNKAKKNNQRNKHNDYTDRGNGQWDANGKVPYGGKPVKAEPRKASAIFALMSELAYVFGKVFFPKHMNFLPINVSHVGSLTILSSDSTTETVFRKDDVARIDADGNISVIHGPSFYDNPVKKLISLTTLKMSLVKITNAAIELMDGEKAMLISDGNLRVLHRRIDKEEGNIVVFFRGSTDDPFITGIAVRQWIGERDMTKLASVVSHLRRRESGAFEEALREQNEQWLLNAAEEFFAPEIAKAEAVLAEKTANIRKDRKVRIGAKTFFVRKGGQVFADVKGFGEVPEKVEHLVRNGAIGPILDAFNKKPARRVTTGN